METITCNYPQIEDDLLQHIQDERIYAAIRGKAIVVLTWNELTEDEQRAAYCAAFEIYA
jgi:hypothetical protein